ncbi:MAG: diacylglycerol kinase family protein [bacterium]|nr:diacylglycerol kinase family protein [bacterium]
MKEKIEHHRISFGNAFAGIIYAFTSQPNFVIHFGFSLLALAAAWLFKISSSELLILVLTISLVLVAEMLNTAIEQVTDLVTSEWRKEAKHAKDVSAGMVLLAATASIFVGIMIFSPKIVNFLKNPNF